MISILEPSKVIVSPIYQLLEIPVASIPVALKPPMATIKKELVAKRASTVSSNLLQNFSKSSLDWFRDLYKKIKI